MIKTLKNKLVSYLYCVPDVNKIITSRKVGMDGYGEPIYKLYLKGEQLSESEENNLFNEMRWFENSRIWEILKANTVENAQKTMFDHAKTTDDLMFGKGILYAVNLQQNIIKVIKNIKR